MDRIHVITAIIVSSVILQVSSYDQPMLLWTQHSHLWSRIRGVMGDPNDWIPQTYKPYVQSISLRNTFKYALDYNPATQEIVWSDILEHRVLKQSLNSSLDKATNDTVEIFKKEGTEVSCLTVDWLAGNVYFIEQTAKFIAVQSLTNYGNNLHKILFKSTVMNPSSLRVDPYKGLLFWSDQQKGTIESSTTTGQMQTTVLNGLSNPLGIALDMEQQNIYYVDGQTINMVSYDGSTTRTLYQGGDTSTYFGITVLNEYIFLTTGRSLQVHIHRKDDGSHIKSSDVDADIYHIISVQDTAIPPHECTNMDCEHICLNKGSDRTGQCACASGYTLQPDGKTCKETSPSYVVSKQNSVILSKALIDETDDAMSISHTVLRDDAMEARAVGVHYDKQYIYYSDLMTDMIYWGYNTGARWKEITAGTRHVEGIAVDWISNTLFWTDKVLQHIMCSQLTGHYHRIHLDNVIQPKDLAIDSVRKRLVWTSNHESHPKIEVVGLNGMERKVLLQEPPGIYGEFKGITVDPATQRIYWSNRGTGVIESIDLDGQGRQTIMANSQIDMYGLGVYGDYLTYTKEQSDSIQFYNTKDNTEMTNVINYWPSHVDPFISNTPGYYDVAVFDSYVQPQQTSACDNNNGGCGQLCFPVTSSERTCGCAIGYVLNQNGRSCDSDILSDKFVLFVDPYHKQIYQIQTDSTMSTTQGMPVPRMEFPLSIDFDISGRQVYWIDRDTRQIKSSYLDGNDARVLYNMPPGSKAKRLAVDPVSRYVFYTDQGDRAIHRIDIEAARHVVHVAQLTDPFAVAVDYNQGQVYWTNGGRLERCDVEDDTPTEVIFTKDNNILTGLTITDGIIYVGVWESGEIYTIDVNSTTYEPVLVTTVGPELYSLAADSQYLYYTKWNEKGVYHVNRNDGTEMTLLDRDIFARITDIKVVEALLPIPVAAVVPPTDNTIIIAAAAAAAFLLALLALIFGLLACRRCKNSSKSSSSSNDSSTGFDCADRDAEYMMYSNSAAFDLRSSNATATNQSPKDTLSTDSGVSGLSVHSSTELIQRSPDLGANNNQGFDNPGYNRSDSDGGEAGSSTNNILNGGVPVLPMVGAPLAHRYTKKSKPSQKEIKRRSKQPDPNDFNLREDKKVATVIQRLATRLRKRLSSVRFDEPQPRPGIETNNPSDVSVNIDNVVIPDRQYPEKNKMPPNKRMIHIPNKLHKEPRGWAPASHNVPRVFKSSLGKAKGQELNVKH